MDEKTKYSLPLNQQDPLFVAGEFETKTNFILRWQGAGIKIESRPKAYQKH